MFSKLRICLTEINVISSLNLLKLNLSSHLEENYIGQNAKKISKEDVQILCVQESGFCSPQCQLFIGINFEKEH